MARLELLLFHDQTPTGTIEWSTTSGTGPWTAVQLTVPRPVLEALDEWSALVFTGSGELVNFTWDGTAIAATMDPSTPTFIWLQFSPSLAELLGFSTEVVYVEDGTPAVSDQTPTGIAEFPVGSSLPRESESSDVSRYRGGRVTAHHWGRTGEATLDLHIPPDLWADLEGAALVSGFGAVKVTWDNEDPYTDDDIDGYYTVFPTDHDIEPRAHTEDTVAAHVTGTLLDPGVTAPAGQSTRWAKLWRAACYGYSVHYFAKVEGIPLLFCELTGDAIAPTNYTLDASLVIDRASRLGPVVSSASNFAAAYDLDLRLLDTTAVRGIMSRPTLITSLRTAMTDTDSGCLVELPGWASEPIIYIGTSAEVITATAGRLLGIAVRGVYGRAKSYRKGTRVSNKPLRWEGRRVEVFAALRDPGGRYVQGANVLSEAVAIGAYYVQDKPVRDGTEWSIQCRDQVRRLTQPLGVAASGRAVWEVDDDGLVTVDPLCTFSIAIDIDGSTIEEHTVRPFFGMTGQLRRSECRAIVAAAFEAACVTSGDISTFRWRRGASLYLGPDDAYDAFGLFCTYAAAGTEERAFIATRREAFTAAFDIMFEGGYEPLTIAGPAGDIELYCDLKQFTTPGAVTVAVVMDEGNPDLVPATGWIQMEGNGNVAYRRYESAVVDTDDPGKVNIEIASSTPFTADEIQAVVDGSVEDVSVKFFWRDTGRIYDILRRAIVSTGDGTHGAYDTLAKGQGLALPSIDATSFEDAFDVYFRDIEMAVGSEAGTSLEELFSGILRISQRALTSRRSADGQTIEIAAVRAGSVDALPVVTIDDDSLASVGGRRPVRVVEAFNSPQAVEIKCRTLPVGDMPAGDASISIAPDDPDTVGVSWDLDIYGVARSAILPAVKSWGVALARVGTTRQVLELALPAWYDVQGGDVVELDLQDPTLWDYAPGVTGEPGYTGMARCLGAPLALTDGLQLVTVMADGILAAGPMAPSLPIVAVNGGGATPTSIDVDDEYYDLLVAAKDGQASWTLLAYLPGQDAGRAEYTCSTVTLPGGGVARVTVTAYPASPAVTLSTSYRLTWPVASQCTDDQDRYLHNTDQAQWG